MKSHFSILLFGLMFFIHYRVLGQSETFVLKGTYSDVFGERVEGPARLIISDGSQDTISIEIMAGEFQTKLNLGKEYVVRLERNGDLPLRIRVDAKGLGEKQNSEPSLVVNLTQLKGTGKAREFWEANFIDVIGVNANTFQFERDTLYFQKIESPLTSSIQQTQAIIELIASSVDAILIYGEIVDYLSGKKIKGGTVVAISDFGDQVISTVAKSGNFKLVLDYHKKWEITLSNQAYYPKKMIIDSRGVPVEEIEGGQSFDFDISLLPVIDGVEFSFCKEAIGYAKYNESTHGIYFDRNYTEKYKEKLSVFEEVYKKAYDEKMKTIGEVDLK